MNKYMWKMGVDESKWRFYDVVLRCSGSRAYSNACSSCHAAISRHKSVGKGETRRRKNDQEKKTEPRKESTTCVKRSATCGTIALLHAVMNNAEKLKFKQGSFFAKFRAQTHGQTSEQRAKSLDESKDLEEEHEVVAREEKADAKSRAFANLHFISLVSVGGVLYELDGRKTRPIAHRSTNPATFLQDSIKVIKKFMKFAPRDQRYTTIVLAPKRAPCTRGWARPRRRTTQRDATRGACGAACCHGDTSGQSTHCAAADCLVHRARCGPFSSMM